MMKKMIFALLIAAVLGTKVNVHRVNKVANRVHHVKPQPRVPVTSNQSTVKSARNESDEIIEDFEEEISEEFIDSDDEDDTEDMSLAKRAVAATAIAAASVAGYHYFKPLLFPESAPEYQYKHVNSGQKCGGHWDDEGYIYEESLMMSPGDRAIEDITRDQCQVACDQKSECKFYVWRQDDRFSRGFCYLWKLNECATTKAHKGYVIFQKGNKLPAVKRAVEDTKYEVVASRGFRCAMWNNDGYIYEQGLMKSENDRCFKDEVTSQKCRTYCNERPECKYYIHNDTNDTSRGWCYLWSKDECHPIGHRSYKILKKLL